MESSAQSTPRKFSWVKFILYSLLFSVVVAIASLIIKGYVSFHIGEDSMARAAYTWKSKAALTTFATWNFLKEHSWDTTDKDVDKCVKMAQGTGKNASSAPDKTALLYDYYPEHFPRYPQYMYYTYDFDWNQEVFLKLRKYMVEISNERDDYNRKKMDTYISAKQEAIRKETNEIVTKPKLCWDLDKYILKDDVSIDPELKKEVNKVTAALHDLLTFLDTCNDEDKILDKTDEKEAENNPIIQKTFKLFNLMNIKYRRQKLSKVISEDLQKKHVLEFWKNFGTVSSSPFESFIYTRLFLIFAFHTTSIEKVESVDTTTKKKKIQNPQKTFEQRHKDFASMMVKAFKNPEKCAEINFFKKFFMPTLAKAEELKLDNDRKKRYFDLMNVEPEQVTAP